MIVHEAPAGPNWLRRVVAVIRRRIILVGILAGAAAFIAYTFGLIALTQRIDVPGITRVLVTNGINIPVNYLGSFASNPKQISIDIKHTHIAMLAAKRREALRKGILLRGENDYVPARIRYGDKSVRVKLRLKGELPDHYRGEKWSFRVVVRDGDTLFGMKRFSLQSPRTRYYVYEWVFQKAMAREGLIGLRYDFIDVTINGKHMGIYAVEEHFEKRLIENNRRPEGPIMFYSDDADIRRYNLLAADPRWRADFQAGMVNVYRKKDTFGSAALTRAFELAKNRMEAYRRGTLPTCDVFDCGKLARWLAMLDLTSGRHNARHGNLKLYFNPVTARLEPIAFDGSAVGVGNPEGGVPPRLDSQVILVEDWFEHRLNQPFYLMFQDTRLFKAYIEELGRVSKPAFLDALFAEIGDELARKLRIVHRDYPHFRFDRSFFYKRQNRIRNFLAPPTGIIPYFRGMRSVGGRRFLEFEIASIVTYPIEVRSLRIGRTTLKIAGDSDRTLAPFIPLTPIRVQDVRFELPDDFAWKTGPIPEMRIGYGTWSGGATRWTKAVPWSQMGSAAGPAEILTRTGNLGKFPFLAADAKSNRIEILPGEWEISEDIVIPPGRTVHAGAGTVLRLTGGASIISYSPVRLVGSENAPVRIYSSDGTGQGVAVIEANGRSRLENVVFQDLGVPDRNGWTLNSAITFYESDVDISRVNLVGNRGAAALRIMRSKFSIDSASFLGSVGNAFAVEFGEGTLRHSVYGNIGRDAVTLSGSKAVIEGVTFDGVNGTALGLGAASTVDADTITIRDAGIGAASRDRSVLTIKRLDLSRSKIGVATYRVRPEFGPAKIAISAFNLADVERPFVIETGSTVSIDGAPIPSNSTSVAKLIDGKPST